MSKAFKISRIVLTVLLVVFIFWDMKGEKISSADFETVHTKVLTAAELPDTMQNADNRMVKRFYGLNANDFEHCVLYSPASNMDAHEMLLIQLKSVDQGAAVEAAIRERLATQKNSFDGYGAEQTKLLNDCVLKVQGNYVLFLVCENAAKAGSAFADAL
ncbi:MAG: DUF4358 domain-containing protein [Clostridiales bacterium]|nr:DUF4358 domain-containing protein [Candidatus Blautia equi]